MEYENPWTWGLAREREAPNVFTRSYFAWASALPSYLEGHCEGLKVWDGDEDWFPRFRFFRPRRGIRGLLLLNY